LATGVTGLLLVEDDFFDIDKELHGLFGTVLVARVGRVVRVDSCNTETTTDFKTTTLQTQEKEWSLWGEGVIHL